MSDELNLMLLAVKNYAKIEYTKQGLNDEDSKMLFELRKYIKTEMENMETFLRLSHPMNKDSEWDREFGFFNCVNLINKIISN